VVQAARRQPPAFWISDFKSTGRWHLAVPGPASGSSEKKTEIKMQAAGGVPLNHENGIFIFTNAAFGFGSLWKLSLAIVFFQCGHSVLVNDYKVL